MAENVFYFSSKKLNVGKFSGFHPPVNTEDQKSHISAHPTRQSMLARFFTILWSGVGVLLWHAVHSFVHGSVNATFTPSTPLQTVRRGIPLWFSAARGWHHLADGLMPFELRDALYMFMRVEENTISARTQVSLSCYYGNQSGLSAYGARLHTFFIRANIRSVCGWKDHQHISVGDI